MNEASRVEVSIADPIALHGFTQLSNFILRNPDLSTNAKTTLRALILSYAWHNNLCFPGQERLAAHRARSSVAIGRIAFSVTVRQRHVGRAIMMRR